MQRLVSPKQAADAIGVSESSLKRWCDHGQLQIIRTAGGHRRLMIGDVLRFVRGSGHELERPEALGLSIQFNDSDTAPQAIQPLFRQALTEGDTATAKRLLLKSYLRGESVSRIADRIIAPSMHEIGELWDCGDVRIYQERRSCEICVHALLELLELQAPLAPNAPIAIGATPPGDPYSIALTAGEVMLRSIGWKTESAGSSAPIETLLNKISAGSCHLVWLSVSYIEDHARFIDEVQSLYDTAIANGVAVAIGGRELTSELRSKLSYSTCCDSFHNLEQFAATIAAVVQRSRVETIPPENAQADSRPHREVPDDRVRSH